MVRANTEGQYLLLGGNCAAIMSAKLALDLEKCVFNALNNLIHI